jgi:hypothetical protein
MGQRVISGVYANTNVYAVRTKGQRSRKPKAAPVTVMHPVACVMGGVEFTGLKVAKVIKSPRTKRLDKQDRMWYAGLSK